MKRSLVIGLATAGVLFGIFLAATPGRAEPAAMSIAAAFSAAHAGEGEFFKKDRISIADRILICEVSQIKILPYAMDV